MTFEDQQLFFPPGSSPAPCLDDTSRINNSSDPKSRSQHALHFCLALGAGKALPSLQEDSMGIFFSLCARQSCDIKPTACYRLGCFIFFFPHLPHFALAQQRSFQLGRACGTPDTPPNFHRESRNLYTNTRKLGSSLLLRGEKY